jgi:hypothetical protein
MMSLFVRKASISADSISRSEGGIWPCSCAVAISMREWSSGGRSAAFEGSSDNELMRTWVERRDVRAAARACVVC